MMIYIWMMRLGRFHRASMDSARLPSEWDPLRFIVAPSAPRSMGEVPRMIDLDRGLHGRVIEPIENRAPLQELLRPPPITALWTCPPP